jgi:hypothetical protein
MLFAVPEIIKMALSILSSFINHLNSCNFFHLFYGYRTTHFHDSVELHFLTLANFANKTGLEEILKQRIRTIIINRNFYWNKPAFSDVLALYSLQNPAIFTPC